MNYEKLHILIDFYVKNKDRIHFNNLEGYKWDILSSIRDAIIAYVKRHYRDEEWDQDFSDFHEFIRKTIGKTGNLVYPPSRSIMQKAADKYPELVRKMFIDLSGFNSEVSLEDRVCGFISSIDTLAKENQDISNSGKSFHNDYRAVSVYLLMMNPELYYNYMYTTFSEFAKFVELKIPHAGDVHLLLEYYKVCKEIEQILCEDHKEWYESYLQSEKLKDPANEKRTDIFGHLLVQDLVFSLYYYYHPEELNNNFVIPVKFNKKPKRKKAIPEKGVIVDYVERERKNTEFGVAVENFVLENERRRVKKYGFDSSRVQHVSKEQGDGLGYDILSCDEDGKDIYIEVKGTKGNARTAFYITDAELQCSIEHKDKYRLHRVYNFKVAGSTGKGMIAEIEGSLESYCLNPVLYRAVF